MPSSPPFRPRVVPTLAMVVAVAVFALAGNWQQGRMATKELLRAQYDALARTAPVPMPNVDRKGDWIEQRFRPVIVRGEFDTRHQIFIDNKVQRGRVGYDVVTPLKLDDGRIVLVDRGWIALRTSRVQLPDAPPPAGEVTLQGRLELPTSRYLELRSEAPAGPVWQNLDPARFAKASGLDVLPVIIEETVAPVPDDGLVRDWPLPDFGVEQHRMYMLQWYGLAALAVILWAVLNWRKRTSDGDRG